MQRVAACRMMRAGGLGLNRPSPIADLQIEHPPVEQSQIEHLPIEHVQIKDVQIEDVQRTHLQIVDVQFADLQRDGDPIISGFVLSRPLISMCLNSFFFMVRFLPFYTSTFFCEGYLWVLFHLFPCSGVCCISALGLFPTTTWVSVNMGYSSRISCFP